MQSNQLDKSLINMSAIARKLGISPSYVGKILSGQRISPKYLELIKGEIKRLIAA